MMKHGLPYVLCFYSNEYYFSLSIGNLHAAILVCLAFHVLLPLLIIFFRYSGFPFSNILLFGNYQEAFCLMYDCCQDFKI